MSVVCINPTVFLVAFRCVCVSVCVFPSLSEESKRKAVTRKCLPLLILRMPRLLLHGAWGLDDHKQWWLVVVIVAVLMVNKVRKGQSSAKDRATCGMCVKKEDWWGGAYALLWWVRGSPGDLSVCVNAYVDRMRCQELRSETTRNRWIYLCV